MRRFLILFCLLSALALTAPPVETQMRGGKGFKGEGMGGGTMGGGPSESTGSGLRLPPEIVGAFAPRGATMEHMKAKGFFATGLEPVYPKEAKCLEVESTFGSWTRSDGSYRSRQFYFGYHGGMDIPAPEGTPILAVAAGTVVHKFVGTGIGGIGVVLQHAPQDTGLPSWTYTEYKHLREMADVKIGQRVEMGEVIAHAGDTGTRGGHYGEAGFSHLHLSAYFSLQKDFITALFFAPVDGQWLDPLALFRGPPLSSAEIHDLPGDRKRVRFAYKTSDGKVVPEGAKLIWPFACKPR